jgi:hypothetical protein
VFASKKWMMVALLLINDGSGAQTKNELLRPLRKLVSSSQVLSKSTISRDTVRLLALMVDFQTDADEKTTGNGKFQTNAATAQLLDPPPHDSLYFNNKIQFVGNYFRRVSNGKLTIIGTVVGNTKRITLSKSMKAYAPPTNITDNTNLALMAKESWLIADSLYPEINFNKYDAFVIFHAGVGRDIDLVSSLAYNPTPYDIPSLYLDSTAFAVALGQSSFQGLVNGAVKNTMILPETESRDLPTGSGTKTIQLSINGMFAASVGSFLGLPDLFDTKTGRSGIGQFGLMDGAAIFAYSGLFPPEPCAWEKMYLGWLTPISISTSTINLSVPAVGLKYPAKQDSVYKIPITSSEYFLVENRIRNPRGTGLDLAIADGTGNVRWIHFTKDTIGFNMNDVSHINGSVVDVSSYDWALIGATDTTGKDSSKIYEGGGVLIWHIDENVIRSGLLTNSVNADMNHRGVDLEEADGAKDIGKALEFNVESGWELDCWFAENPAVPYKNIFDQNSFPKSNSFSGAASLVTIKNISVRSPRMTLTVEIGNQILRRDLFLHRTFNAERIQAYPTSTKNHLYIPSPNGIYALQNNGQSVLGAAKDLLSTVSTGSDVAVKMLPDSTEILASVRDSVLSIFRISFHGDKTSLDSSIKSYPIHFTTSPCFVQLDSLSLLVGTSTGMVVQLSTRGDIGGNRQRGSDPVLAITILPTTSTVRPNEYFFISGNKIYGEHSTVDLPISSNSWMLAGAVSPKGNFLVSAEKNGNTIVSCDQSLSRKNFELRVSGGGIQEIALADIDGDGEKDVLIQTSKNLSVLNRSGAAVDGFPIQTRSSLEFTGTPLVVDFNGDGKPEIVLCTNDGEMWVYDRTGKLLTGYPMQVATAGRVFPMMYQSPSPSNTLGIAILSEGGSLDAFLTSNSTRPDAFIWWQHGGDEGRSSTEASVVQGVSKSTEFFPQSRVYNWPNPVYSQSTQIRYYTNEDATVMVTILDLSGHKITELSGRGTAGMDNEITWNVSQIQSGIYLARVEARGANKSEVVFTKIAVVK